MINRPLICRAAGLAMISFLFLLQFSAPVFAAPAKVGTSPVPSEQARHSDALGQASTVLANQVGTYNQLVHAIREVRTESQKRTEQAVQQEKVREAWETGRLIDEHVLQYKERADYDQQVLVRLAKDLGTSKTELYYMLEFARAYPIFPHAGKLSWSEYRELLVVKVSEKRNSLAERAEKENWSRPRLREEIRNATKGEKTAPVEVLTAQPGKPGTYRVLKATVGEHKGELVLDLGFSCYFKPEKETGLREGDIVTAVRDAKGNDSLQIVPSPHPLPGGEDQGEGASDLLYTYRVDVIEVIDGDTLKVAIPLGFGFTIVQKLRLRGLDAPEIESAEGKEAKEFLEKMLGIAEGVPSTVIGEEPARDAVPRTPYGTKVLIKTVKSDKYDRYLADVFIDRRPQTTDRSQSEVSSPQSDFVYVNQALLDEGLAVRISE